MRYDDPLREFMVELILVGKQLLAMANVQAERGAAADSLRIKVARLRARHDEILDAMNVEAERTEAEGWSPPIETIGQPGEAWDFRRVVVLTDDTGEPVSFVSETAAGRIAFGALLFRADYGLRVLGVVERDRDRATGVAEEYFPDESWEGVQLRPEVETQLSVDLRRALEEAKSSPECAIVTLDEIPFTTGHVRMPADHAWYRRHGVVPAGFS